MIVGTVRSLLHAVVPVTVRGPRGREKRLEAVVDTGFDGWLSLDPDTIRALQIPWRRRGRALLADGSESVVEIYEGTVVWDRRQRRIPIDEAPAVPLIGMALLGGYRLDIEVRTNGKVTIRPLPVPGGG